MAHQILGASYQPRRTGGGRLLQYGMRGFRMAESDAPDDVGMAAETRMACERRTARSKGIYEPLRNAEQTLCTDRADAVLVARRMDGGAILQKAHRGEARRSYHILQPHDGGSGTRSFQQIPDRLRHRLSRKPGTDKSRAPRCDEPHGAAFRPTSAACADTERQLSNQNHAADLWHGRTCNPGRGRQRKGQADRAVFQTAQPQIR